MGRNLVLWLATIMMLGAASFQPVPAEDTLHLMVLLVGMLNVSAVFICRRVLLRNHMA